MQEARRRFLWCAGATLSGTVLGLPATTQTPRRGLPTPPQGADQSPKAPQEPKRQISRDAVLRQHEKVFRECLAALTMKVGQLNQEVESLHSEEMFSVSVFKQSTEIEKLAKQLKNLAKG